MNSGLEQIKPQVEKFKNKDKLPNGLTKLEHFTLEIYKNYVSTRSYGYSSTSEMNMSIKEAGKLIEKLKKEQEF